MLLYSFTSPAQVPLLLNIPEIDFTQFWLNLKRPGYLSVSMLSAGLPVLNGSSCCLTDCCDLALLASFNLARPGAMS